MVDFCTEESLKKYTPFFHNNVPNEQVTISPDHGAVSTNGS